MLLSPNLLQHCAFNPNARQDMDLLNENRSLIHTGKFLRQPETGFELSGWTELFALLFDNYRMSRVYIAFWSRTHETSDSCYDETEGEGWNHKVPSVSTRKSPLILRGITQFLTHRVAHSPGPSYFSNIHGSSDTTRWQVKHLQ